jgi:hypothetical protein
MVVRQKQKNFSFPVNELKGLFFFAAAVAGLPDFSRYIQHTKTEKIPIANRYIVQNGHKIYQMAVKKNKWP